jgi:hypothetical protein
MRSRCLSGPPPFKEKKEPGELTPGLFFTLLKRVALLQAKKKPGEWTTPGFPPPPILQTQKRKVAATP